MQQLGTRSRRAPRTLTLPQLRASQPSCVRAQALEYETKTTTAAGPRVQGAGGTRTLTVVHVLKEKKPSASDMGNGLEVEMNMSRSLFCPNHHPSCHSHHSLESREGRRTSSFRLGPDSIASQSNAQDDTMH